MNSKKDKLSKLEIALKKNLKKRKIFQKKQKKNNKQRCPFNQSLGLKKCAKNTI